MKHLKTLFEKPINASILVVGDLLLDEYLFGDVERISPEAPIPIVLLKDTPEDFRLGGAGNVALNLASLGISTTLISGIGADPQGEQLKYLLEQAQIHSSLLTLNRPTPWKRRILGQHKQMLRIDREQSKALSESETLDFQKRFLSEVEHCSLVLLSDYGKGILSPPLLHFILHESKQRHLKVVVDPKGKNYQKYRGASVITPNKKEAEEATSLSLEGIHPKDLEQCSSQLLENADLEAVIITLGAEGVCLKEKGKELFFQKSQARSVYDITGAGDTFIATLSYGLAQHYPYIDAVQLANIAAGLKVAKQGTQAVSREELQHALNYSQNPFFFPKILKDPPSLFKQNPFHLLLLQSHSLTFELLEKMLPLHPLFIGIWEEGLTPLQIQQQTQLFSTLEGIEGVFSTQSLDFLFQLPTKLVYYFPSLFLTIPHPTWLPLTLSSS
jgi:D-beta-D-heptose 7-phosphate kinase/D-beta-D-heptose 1-phosphate adenosyltransferase